MTEGTNVPGQPAAATPAQASDADAAIARQAQEQAQLEGQADGGGDNLPEKFKGKTPSDIARAYEELESKLGQQGQMLGQMQQQLTYFQSIAQQQQALRETREAPAIPPPPATKWDWDKPEESARQTVREEIAPVVRQMQYQTAQMMAGYAREQAKAANPGLFNGVENEVNNVIDQGIRSGWLRPENVANPETWRMAAWQVQGMKAAYNPASFASVPRSPNPMNPVGTETPQGFRTPNYQTNNVALDDKSREMIRKWGADEKDIVKSIAEDRKAGI